MPYVVQGVLVIYSVHHGMYAVAVFVLSVAVAMHRLHDMGKA